MFRDSAAYIPRYMAQVTALRDMTDVRLVIAEGDSTDLTLDVLKACVLPNDTLLKVDHGGAHYGSVDNLTRWQNIAVVARAIVAEIGDPGDAFVWVEADLLWEPGTILGLLQDLDTDGVPAVAPLCLSGQTELVYDTWGFRKDGEQFTRHPPYYFSEQPPGGLVKIDSCGSCYATKDWDRVRLWDGMWPYTHQGRLWLDPELAVRHP